MKLNLTFAAVALILPGYFAARQMASWPDRLRYPGELDSVEGKEMADMVMLRQGAPVYAPASPERFNAAGYGPFFYLLGSRLVNPEEPSFFFIRMVPTAATLGLAAGCGLLALWLARSYLAAALAPLIFLAYTLSTEFGVAVHCDAPALLLWFWGFLVAYRFRNSAKILLATPLMVLGFYYKGQYVVALLATLLFLVLEKRFRLAALFAALFGLGAASLFLLFQFVVFAHQAFYLHAFVYNAIPFSSERGHGWLVVLGIILAAPLLAAALFLRSYPNQFLACYFLWAILLPPITISKQGSGPNYCFELLLLLSSVLAAYVAKSASSAPRAVLALCLLGIALWLGQFPKRMNDPEPVDFTQDRAVQLYLRTHFPPHTTALGVFTGDLLRAGLDTPIANIYQYSWLMGRGTLPEQGFVTQLRNRRFGLIFLNTDLLSESTANEGDYWRVTEPMRQAILENYKPDATFEFHLWDKRHCHAWIPRKLPLHRAATSSTRSQLIAALSKAGPKAALAFEQPPRLIAEPGWERLGKAGYCIHMLEEKGL